MKKISSIILRALGWRFVNIMPDVPKCIIAVAPHTSNMDFIIGKLAYTALGRNARFLIKREWFVFPLNLIFRSIGGIPIERSKKSSTTDTLAREFARHDELQIAVTPEGTRKRVSEWKKGFYFIALKAEVPIMLIGIDYKKKELIFLDLFHPTGDYESDIAIIKSHYVGLQGRHPKNFSI